MGARAPEELSLTPGRSPGAMKETTYKTTVYGCSGCGYWSLLKHVAASHVRVKCPGAAVNAVEKMLTHRDASFETDDEATLHQCSNCGYTSNQPTHVRTHARAKCPAAEVVSEKRKLSIGDVPVAPPSMDVAIGQNCSNVNVINRSTCPSAADGSPTNGNPPAGRPADTLMN